MASYANDKGITPTLLWVVIWLGIALAVIFTFARSLVRLSRQKRFASDDYLIWIALATVISIGIVYSLNIEFMFELYEVTAGEGLPSATFWNDLLFFLRCQFAAIVLFWTALWAIKFAFLMYYKPLFDGLSGTSLKLWWGVFIFTLLSYIGCWVTQMLSCRPISNYFTATCLSAEDDWAEAFSLYFATAVDITCDLLIMALPLKLLYGLRINKRQKSGLAAIFAIGCIIIVFAVVRVVATHAVIQKVDTILLALWSMIEASVAVIVACLPPFRVYFAGRSDTSYQGDFRYGPATRSRNVSRMHRQRKGSVRLDDLASETTFQNSDLGAGPKNIGYTVDAESDPPASRNWDGLSNVSRGSKGSGGSSPEHVLPIMVPDNVVHVRNDIYMTSEPV